MLQKQLDVVLTTPAAGTGPLMANLEERGLMFGAGPFWTDDKEGRQGEGMVINRAASLAEARAIAASDSMHASGARTFTARPWPLNEGTITLKIRHSDGLREIG
jgi:uncharacterized protein YciI